VSIFEVVKILWPVRITRVGCEQEGNKPGEDCLKIHKAVLAQRLIVQNFFIVKIYSFFSFFT
jgi:hypothetical protein